MDTHSFFRRLRHSQVPCLAALTLVTLTWSNPVFSGEIHDAAAKGDLEKVKVLLKGNPGTDVNAKDNEGRTPLHAAAYNGHKDVVQLLLANKADVNAKDAYSQTPLHEAAVKGYRDISQSPTARSSARSRGRCRRCSRAVPRRR